MPGGLNTLLDQHNAGVKGPSRCLGWPGGGHQESKRGKMFYQNAKGKSCQDAFVLDVKAGRGGPDHGLAPLANRNGGVDRGADSAGKCGDKRLGELRKRGGSLF